MMQRSVFSIAKPKATTMVSHLWMMVTLLLLLFWFFWRMIMRLPVVVGPMLRKVIAIVNTTIHK
jgi:hypothetical protein